MNKEVKDEIVKEAILEVTESSESKTCELIIREGEALPALKPVKLDISGIIDTPLRFLKKRVMELDQLKGHVLVDRENLSIELVIDESDPYLRGTITGRLSEHPTFKKLGVNSGRYVTTYEMAELIKMNRSAFENRQEAMQLVSALKNFKGKVEKDMEKANDDRGNRKILLHQTVESNVPDSFKISIPLFKGMPKETFEVEVYFNPDDLTCTLVSPAANDILEDVRDSTIDDVIRHIIDVAPEVVVIEK